jgi:hypothetical protein
VQEAEQRSAVAVEEERFLGDGIDVIAFAQIVALWPLLTISPLVGHLLTNRTIRPLAQMIHTTARLHPVELAQRVE